MRPGDLVRLLCDDRFYGRGGKEMIVGGVVVQRDEMVTVIEPPGRATRNVLVLHPRHGLGVIYAPSLEVVDATG
jgi:hypothetical protein